VLLKDTKGLHARMAVAVAPGSVKTGYVVFTVTNDGTIDHEVVVLKLAKGQTYKDLKVQTVDRQPNRVNESAKVGETGNPPLKPHETRSFAVHDMTAGSYAIVCNISGHYALGMAAPFVVT
jgi:uncharacterized cupredoxin-like copper-binding protein